MSSLSTYGTPTPLCHVFRGLRTSHIVSKPSTTAEWQSAISELKGIYMEGKWKECQSKCLRLVDACETKPVIQGYLLYLIGSCAETKARNMHQYSASKSQKLEDAATWFERCEAVLSNTIILGDVSGECTYEDIDAVFPTPQQTSCHVHSYMGDDLNVTPNNQPPTTDRLNSNERLESDGRDVNNQKFLDMADAISKIIDGDLRNPYKNESDPFLSISSANTPQKSSLEKVQDWTASLPRLTPSPLRIHKAEAYRSLSFEALPSSLSNMSLISSEMGIPEEEEDFGGQQEEIRIQANKEAWRAEIDQRIACRIEKCENLFGRHVTAITTREDAENSYAEKRKISIQAKKKAWRVEIDRRVALKLDKGDDTMFKTRGDQHHGMHIKPEQSSAIESHSPSFSDMRKLIGPYSGSIPRTLSWMIRDCLGDDEKVNMNASSLAPIPRTSSAKPLPLFFKTKKSEHLPPTDGDPNSDKESLACLELAWKLPSTADLQSLYNVEGTWARLAEEYHLQRKLEQREDYEASQARLAEYNAQLSSLSRSLRQNIHSLRQLAAEIEHHRSMHMQGQKVARSKSYWSFSADSKGNIMNNTEAIDGGYDEHRDKPEMRRDVGWAAPGTVLNETKETRIERLKKDNFQMVGLRNEKRGHKGHEWYSYVCEEALGDVGRLFQQ